MNRAEWLCFILLIIIAVLLRIPNLNAASQGDETYFPELVQYQVKNGFSFTMELNNGITYWEDLPLNGLIYVGYSFLFGYSIIKMRFLSILISVINLSLVFFMAKKIFGIKGGLFALGLMTFSYWHIFESFTIGRDGSFVMLLYIAIFYVYIKYQENSNMFYLLLISVLITIFLFIKSSGVLVIAMLLLLLLKDRHFFQIFILNCRTCNFKQILYSRQIQKMLAEFIFLIIPVCAYVSFLLFICNWNFEMFSAMYLHAAPTSMISFTLFSVLRVFIYLVLWGSPLIFGLAVLSLSKYEWKKFPFLIWILVPIIAYSFAEYRGSVDRYLSVVIPAMCILGGAFLGSIKISRKARLIFATAAGFIAFQLLSIIQVEYIPHNISQYLINFITLNWNFIFPFYGASQPTFMVSFIVIGITLALSGLLFACYLLKIKRDLVFLLFVSLTFSFSLVVIEECDFHPFFPDFKTAIADTVNYVKQNNLPMPIITPHRWLRLHFGIDYSKMIIFDKRNIDIKVVDQIKKQGGTLVLIHYPNNPYESVIDALPGCRLNKELIYNDIRMSSIYNCDKSN